MSLSATIQLEQIQQALRDAEIGMHPVELQAVVTGLIAGGVTLDERGWRRPFYELVNDGQKLPEEIYRKAQALYREAAAALSEGEMNFNLLLPEDDDASLAQRLEALSLWTQGFLTAIAMVQPELNKAPADLKEMIEDLGAIVQVDQDVEDNDDNEHAYTELSEYVKLVVISCFAEYGNSASENNTNPTIH
ncbi:UPF0149 family protein [Paraferrimonas sedimenticola]|uniref:YecA family protein n=1 Tax=Paraferrimonas sedimenticola TaxID=375674 RepID=A0AA37W0T7_9GAMM|nr:UPF0149 family protein [Paraferrimonas sedimenticola]GLP95517.1 hypothetical protein GCM10007895_08230 [Paraferrimonas sedimenticola]